MESQIVAFIETALPILLIILVGFFMLRRVANWYKKVPPNIMAVISGRKHKVKVTDKDGHEHVIDRGYRYVIGGGTLVIPLFEQKQDMALNVMQIEATVTDVPDKDGVLVSVGMNANIKIKSDDQGAPLAIERFLGKNEAEIKQIAKNTLEGNLRNVTGRLTIEQLRQDRQTFMQAVVTELGEDLGKMGLGVDGAQIQTISDKRGYLEAIGKKKTADTVAAGTIGEAEAKRDADQKSAAARQIGETAKAEAEKNISDAQRDRDMAIADNEARVRAQQAQIPIAADIAAANRTAELNKATVDADKAKVTAGIALQTERQKLNEAELEATVVTTARKGKDAKIIAAEADQRAAELEGEAYRIKSEKEGLGIQQKQTGEAQGRIQLATANQAELVAAAEGNKAGLLAVAAGKQAELEAEGKGQVALAEGIQAKLLAEAAGVAAKAEAYSKLDPTGRMLMLLAAVPPVIDSLGIAVERVAKPFAEAMGEGLGNIDEVRLINMGAGQPGGANMLTQFAATPVETLYTILQKLRATNFWPVVEGLAKQAGIDVDALTAAVATEGTVEPQPSHEEAAPPAPAEAAPGNK